MWPRESGSSGLPRTAVTRSPSRVIRSPQIASQMLQTPIFSVVVIARDSATPACRSLALVRIAHYCPIHGRDPAAQGGAGPAVLAVVEEEDGYGYDVVRRLRAAGFDDVGDASVYGTLRRLYAAGLLASYVVPSESGPHRKYYGITPRVVPS